MQALRSPFPLLVAAAVLALLPVPTAGSAGDGASSLPGVVPSRGYDLFWYPSADGGRQPLRTAAGWEQRRADIRARFEEVAGPLPDPESAPDLEVRISETLETAAYRRHTLSLAAEPGDRLTAYLYIPCDLGPGERRAGVVALHPTHPLGKGVVDGQSERPNRAYARELAGRGFVVIAPDYVSFGEQAGYDSSADRYRSGTMKGIWNHRRCVDLLVAREEVDPDRIGVIGHSLGGHNAIFLGLFDPRVRAIVSSCGWTPFHDYYEGNLAGWASDRYLPALREVYDLDPDRVPFDFPELIAALAPRPFFSNSPIRDANFDYRGVEKAVPPIRRIYELHGAPERLRVVYPDADHDFPGAVREEAYRFLETWLAPGAIPSLTAP